MGVASSQVMDGKTASLPELKKYRSTGRMGGPSLGQNEKSKLAACGRRRVHESGAGVKVVGVGAGGWWRGLGSGELHWCARENWRMCKRGQQIPLVAWALSHHQLSPQNIRPHPWAPSHRARCRPALAAHCMSLCEQAHAQMHSPACPSRRWVCRRSWRTWGWSWGRRGSPPDSWTTGTGTWGNPPPPRSSTPLTCQKAPI